MNKINMTKNWLENWISEEDATEEQKNKTKKWLEDWSKEINSNKIKEWLEDWSNQESFDAQMN